MPSQWPESGAMRESDGKPGAWLSSAGPYRNHVESMVAVDPALRSRDRKNRRVPFQDGAARASVLEIPTNDAGTYAASQQVVPTHFSSLQDLQHHLDETVKSKSQTAKRIYLIEGLAPDYINCLGSHFGMEPSFFVKHERTSVWSTLGQGYNDETELPSMLTPSRQFLLRYFEARYFEDEITHFQVSCARTGRHVGTTRMAGDLNQDQQTNMSRVGILRRKCSYWSRVLPRGGWDGESICMCG
jgi:hypothetical protein